MYDYSARQALVSAKQHQLTTEAAQYRILRELRDRRRAERKARSRTAAATAPVSPAIRPAGQPAG